MICISPDPQPLPHSGEALFTRTKIAADAFGAAQTRVQFSDWLMQQFTLGEQRLSDLLLATYEALANAAEFAYPDAHTPGTMDLHAHYDSESDCLRVTVSDQGAWRPPVEVAPGTELHLHRRGRGIPLMRVLADEAAIDTTTTGTQVRLSWHPLLPPRG